jgi:hypothetical protein
VDPIERLDQIANDQIFRGLGCRYGGLLVCHALPFESKRSLWALLFRAFFEDAKSQNRMPTGNSLLAPLPFSLPGANCEHGRAVGDLGEQCRVGAGHPHLRAQFGEFAVQRAAPSGIEMRDNFVE